jgi:integrase
MVEQSAVNRWVVGSSPTSGANFPNENGISSQTPQDSPNITAELPGESEEAVKFPKRLRYKGKGKVLATIYKRPAHPPYRLYWRATTLNEAGQSTRKSHTKDFATYSEAKRAGDKQVAELAKASDAAKLTPGQASDAIAALERLQKYYESTGRRLSLRAAVADYCESAGKLRGHTLGEAVDGFVSTVAVVKRKQLKEAVDEFVIGRKHLSESKNGERSKHNPKYEHNVKSWLEAFAASFPGSCVCELTKEHLAIYFQQFKELSSKSRNARRVTLKMFLAWCVNKDFLSQSHRLLQAVEFKTEDAETSDIDFYRPTELKNMLDTADAGLLPMIALGGLAGLRREEILRLNWADVWRVKGKIEIGKEIAKGRRRRLVSINPALAAWLKPYRRATGRVWTGSSGELEKAYAKLRAELEIPARRNGLRHSFITFHMATHTNENLTAAEAGNSPQMIHEHYRALATKKEARAWFAVRPAKSGKVIHLPEKRIGA